MEYQELFNKLTQAEQKCNRATEILRALWYVINDQNLTDTQIVESAKNILKFNVKDPTERHNV